MASINKLSVRGVRAFSPDDDEQVLDVRVGQVVVRPQTNVPARSLSRWLISTFLSRYWSDSK